MNTNTIQINQAKNSLFLVPKKRRNISDEEKNGERIGKKKKIFHDTGEINSNKIEIPSDRNIIYTLKKKEINKEYKKRLEALCIWKLYKLTELEEELNKLTELEEEIENNDNDNDEQEESIHFEEISFYFFYKNQFLIDNGRSACACISLTLIYYLLIYYSKIEFKELNYEEIINSGIKIWEIWKEETKTTENFVNVHNILDLDKFKKTKSKLNIIKEFAGSLVDEKNEIEDENYQNQKKRSFWSIFDTMKYIHLNFYNEKIACSLTLKDYTITIFKEKNSEAFFLFDSHGIGKYTQMSFVKGITNQQRKRSLLIEFKHFSDVIKYIKNRYPVEIHSIKEDFFNDQLENYDNCYSLILFSSNFTTDFF